MHIILWLGIGLCRFLFFSKYIFGIDTGLSSCRPTTTHFKECGYFCGFRCIISFVVSTTQKIWMTSCALSFLRALSLSLSLSWSFSLFRDIAQHLWRSIIQVFASAFACDGFPQIYARNISEVHISIQISLWPSMLIRIAIINNLNSILVSKYLLLCIMCQSKIMLTPNSAKTRSSKFYSCQLKLHQHHPSKSCIFFRFSFVKPKTPSSFLVPLKICEKKWLPQGWWWSNSNWTEGIDKKEN